MIATALRTLLLNDSAVAGLVGERIIVDRYPQANEVTPAIVLWVEDEKALDALDGPLGMDQPRVRIACYAKTRTGASSLRLEVRRTLGGYSGVVGGYYIKGIAQIMQRGEQYLTDRPLAGSDESRYVSTQDFRVSYDYQQVAP